ncbi:MAG: hypothetical protein ACI9TH_000845 [Kiritimatiellia bacterium]|jgi:hypothetical protein
MKYSPLLLTWLALVLAGVTAQAEDFRKDIEPLLITYCFDCHGDGAGKGDFSLDTYTSLEKHLVETEIWMPVWENMRAQIMPPSEKKQPSLEEREKILKWIEQAVFKLDPNQPDPGRVTVRRLNREEYEHTIQDVLGYRFNARKSFPPDDSGYGFDNIGDALNLSSLLMEKYISAAHEIVGKVVHAEGQIIPSMTVGGYDFRSPEKRKADSINFDQPGVYAKSLKIDHPGEYRMSVSYQINGAEKDTSNTASLILRANGQEVLRQVLAWGDTQTIKVVKTGALVAGANAIEFELVQTAPPGDGEKKLNLRVHSLELMGPLDGSHRIFPSGYDKIFVEGPPGDEREAYFQRLIQHWGVRLWRRPLDENDMRRLSALGGSLSGEPAFERAFADVLTALLISPRFLFRMEIQPEPNNPGAIVPVDEYALASRLSYFLWRSAPDAELLDLAEKGELRKNLEAQVARLIKDRKSERFVRSFSSQWLQTRNLDLVDIDPRRVLGIKDEKEAERFYNYRVRQAMQEETEMLFAHIFNEDRSVLDFLLADYTFVNEYLAVTYGMEGIKGNEMRKVDLPKDSPRGGILGQGTFLTITSNATRTSPVKRGLFVLENLLAAPAPPPPGEVPTVEEQRHKKGNKELTMRELMAVHREDKVCAGCHARFDPIGEALDNFNAFGMWRDTENGKPILSGGKLITGEAFGNAKELSQVLATARRGDFYRCLTEKMLTFAIGRGVEYYDAPTVDSIVQQLEKAEGKMSVLVNGIVHSAPFQLRRGDGDPLKASKSQ